MLVYPFVKEHCCRLAAGYKLSTFFKVIYNIKSFFQKVKKILQNFLVVGGQWSVVSGQWSVKAKDRFLRNSKNYYFQDKKARRKGG